MFTSIMVCGRCGNNLQMRGYSTKGGKKYYGCRLAKKRHDYQCDNRRFIEVDNIQAYLTALLQEATANGLDAVMQSNGADRGDELVALADEKIDIEKQMKRLIRKQATAPDELADLYDEELDHLSQRLSVISTRRNRLENEVKRNHIRGGQTYALEDIQRMGMDAFWQLPEPEVNQLLQRVLGNWRLVGLDGEIVGIANRSV